MEALESALRPFSQQWVDGTAADVAMLRQVLQDGEVSGVRCESFIRAKLLLRDQEGKAAARADLQRAVSGDAIEAVQEAIRQAETAHLPEEEVRPAKDIVVMRISREFEAAAASGDADRMRTAILSMPLAGVCCEEIRKAEIREQEVLARMSIRTSVDAKDKAQLLQAIKQAENVGLDKASIGAATAELVALTERERLNTLDSLEPLQRQLIAKYVSQKGKLKEANLGRTGLLDNGLRALAQSCPNLRSVFLHETWITDSGLEFLGRHAPDLQLLELSFTKITDEGVSALAKQCPRLQQLVLTRTLLSDTGLVALAEACPQLQDLNMRHTRITNAGLMVLEEKCRGLKIVTVGEHLKHCEAATIMRHRKINVKE